MADKMMRLAGRGADGTAKPLSAESNGHLNTKLNGKSTTFSSVVIGAGEVIEVARFFKEGYTAFLLSAHVDGKDQAKNVDFIVQGHRSPDSNLTPLANVDFSPYSNIVSQRNDASLGFVYSDVFALIGKTPVTTWATGLNRVKYMEEYLPIHGQVWRILAYNNSTSSRALTRLEVAVK